MKFHNRIDAGEKLSALLANYRHVPSVVFALPRGGVVVAAPIATYLQAPLDLILAHKIGHPYQPEYAIAAISESGFLAGNTAELTHIDPVWLERAKRDELREIARKRQIYLQNIPKKNLQNQVTVLVDDGIATGLTMEAGVYELKSQNPAKIVVAVPVCPEETARKIANMVDDFICPIITPAHQFLGAVGAYYHQFEQVDDKEVLALLRSSVNTLDRECST